MKNQIIICLMAMAAVFLHAGAVDVATTAGELSGKVTDYSITDLTVTGTMDFNDFYFIADNLKQLRSLDLTDVRVVGSSSVSRRYWQDGFKDDELPVGALGGMNLTTVKLPSSLQSIGQAALAGCIALEEVTLPATLDSIGEYAFAGCTSLQGVTLPASVRVVATGAFVHCTSLTRFDVEPSSRLERVDATALMDCPALTAVALGPSVQYLGERALLGASVQHIDLTANERLAEIGDWALAQSPVNEISLPSSVTRVGDGAFFGDDQLTAVRLGGSVVELNDYLMAGTGLNGELDLTGVSRIGNYTFYNVSELPEVTLPATVTWLGSFAMAGMTGMTALTSEAVDVPALGDSVWAGVNQSLIPLTVPDEAREHYQEAEQWKEFYFYVEPTWLRGDVNNDGEVNIADVNTLIDIILGGRFDEGTMRRADVNEDGEIGIADVNTVIDIILNPGAYAAPAVDTGDTMHLDDVTLRPGEERTLTVTLDHAEAYSALQCDIILPAGLTLVNTAALGQTTETRVMGDQWVRTLTYSMDKRRFSDEDGVVLTLTVRADDNLPASGQLTISNIVLADEHNVGWHADDCVAMVNSTTGVEDVTAGGDRVWVEGNTLCIDSRLVATARVSAINGMTRDLSLDAGVNRYRMQQGFYVVVLNGRSYKVAIR